MHALRERDEGRAVRVLCVQCVPSPFSSPSPPSSLIADTPALALALAPTPTPPPELAALLWDGLILGATVWGLRRERVGARSRVGRLLLTQAVLYAALSLVLCVPIVVRASVPCVRTLWYEC